LNGYGFGARYDGTLAGSRVIGSCAGRSDITQWHQTLKDDTRAYIEAQLDTYESFTNGWIFWTFKTEAAHEWDLFKLMDYGVFPQPLTDRKFPNICSY
jgi:glucan 1,3-beta-glucosidase